MATTYVTLVAATAIWGAQFASAKFVVGTLPPLPVAFARNGVATILFVALALSLPGGLRVRLADLPTLLLIGAASAVYSLCFFMGLQFAPSADGALLMPTMNPVFTVLVSWLLGHETVTRRQLAGMVMSGVGVGLVFLAVGLGGAPAVGQGRVLGDLLFLASSLSWAVLSSFGRPMFARYGVTRAIAMMNLPTLALLGVAAWLTSDMSALLRPTPLDAGLILLMGVLGAFLAFIWFNQAVARIGAGATARFNNLTPVWGVAISMVALAERPLPAELAGAALLALGVWVSSTRRPTTAGGARPRAVSAAG